MKKSRDEKTNLQLCKNLKMEEFEPGETVFEYMAEGDLFYIIIEGEVEVRVPLPIELEDEDATP